MIDVGGWGLGLRGWVVVTSYWIFCNIFKMIVKKIENSLEFVFLHSYIINNKNILMGSCVSSAKIPQSTCYKCNINLPLARMNTHQCQFPKPLIRPKYDQLTPDNELATMINKATPDLNQKMKIKVPKDKSKTKFFWKQQQALFYPQQIKNIPRQHIRNGRFQEKLTWFRIHLETRRISWQKGCDTIKVDRWNILFSSLQNLKKINSFYKQLKIQFTDQKVDDAGGLLRQWMHLCVKQIMSKQSGIFKQCNTEETAYKFIWDRNMMQEVAIQALNLLGLIIGKALFERISLNCYLDRTILRQICSQPVHIQDVYSYDKQLYTSWTTILTMDSNKVQQLQLDGCAYHTHGQNDLQRIQLFPNGGNTTITGLNRDKYITEMIHLYCTKSIQLYLDTLIKSINKIIPADLLSIFEPHQMEMLLNGPTNIDIKDWKIHTVYEGYNESDQIITWFWQNVQKYQQQGLQNLLHYCTGSVRVPILGFKYLESNRGQVRPFTIRKVQYEKFNPFPKSHTCFNRLQLPAYTSRQELEDRMRVIMVEELNHFGLS